MNTYTNNIQTAQLLMCTLNFCSFNNVRPTIFCASRQLIFGERCHQRFTHAENPVRSQTAMTQETKTKSTNYETRMHQATVWARCGFTARIKTQLRRRQLLKRSFTRKTSLGSGNTQTTFGTKLSRRTNFTIRIRMLRGWLKLTRLCSNSALRCARSITQKNQKWRKIELPIISLPLGKQYTENGTISVIAYSLLVEINICQKTNQDYHRHYFIAISYIVLWIVVMILYSG